MDRFFSLFGPIAATGLVNASPVASPTNTHTTPLFTEWPDQSIVHKNSRPTTTTTHVYQQQHHHQQQHKVMTKLFSHTATLFFFFFFFLWPLLVTATVGPRCNTVLFNVDADGHVLEHGDAANITYPYGVSVTNKQDEEIVIYKTGIYGPNVSGADPDLELGIGNALIVQNKLYGTDESVGYPDDDPQGGWIVFEFACALKVKFLEFIDTEEFPFVDFYNATGHKVKRMRGPKTGDFAAAKGVFNVKAVQKVEVKMRGSGAINKIRVCAPCAAV